LKKLKIFSGIILILGILYLPLWQIALPRPQQSFFSEDVLVISHQGGDYLYPSNTLYAFEKSAQIGVDVIELDVHASKDGHLVVIHDDSVDRTTQSTGLVKEKTLSELQELDAGYHWSPERKEESFPYRGQGITIPSLEQVFQTFPDYRINIEIKQQQPRITETLCKLIRQYNKQEQVLVVSFYDSEMKDFRQQCPEVITAGAPNEIRNFYILHRAFLANLYKSNADAFQVPEYQDSLHIVTKRFAKDAKQKNIQVHVWTVDDVTDMQRMIDLGVNGIITDRPDRLMKLLGRTTEIERPEGVPE
jgi:glycerophosphoryl diester phosphodiesterase